MLLLSGRKQRTLKTSAFLTSLRNEQNTPLVFRKQLQLVLVYCAIFGRLLLQCKSAYYSYCIFF
jgi:hypothetical protein